LVAPSEARVPDCKWRGRAFGGGVFCYTFFKAQARRGKLQDMRFLAWASWLSFGAAVLAAGALLFSHWGVNARALGAGDAGLALFFSFLAAFLGIGSLYAAPLLALVGVLTLFFQRHAGLRFLAASVACAVPLAVLTWLER
jgi:hypothetical protein